VTGPGANSGGSPGSPDGSLETQAIRIQSERGPHREHSVPLYLTSSFVFDSAEQAKAVFSGEEEGLIYSRYGNPNTDELIRKLCVLEGTDDGLAAASGMAAMFASIAGLVRSGDHIVASRALFGSNYQILSTILPRWGVETTFVDPADPAEWEASIRPTTRMLFAETPSNPGLELIDIAALGRIAADRGVILNVDNCFATPCLQQPATLGSHLVTHSATKFMDGQGRVLGGAILGPKDLIDEIRFFMRQTGPSLSPFNAWVLSKSLETLSVRMERHCANALALARRLETDRRVHRVRYPFLESHPQHELARRQMKLGGGVVTFDVEGGESGGMAFLNGLAMVSRSPNLGDTRSIATHPATTTHSRMTEDERLRVGIAPGTVRVSVGLESIDDIIADVDQALGRR
jgi:O-succinylhomoserine sulfhydrylase